MKRRGYTGTVSVDIDVSDVLDELADEDLIAEMNYRNLSLDGPGDSFDLLKEVHWHLLHAGVQSALAMLESAMNAQVIPDSERQSQLTSARLVS